MTLRWVWDADGVVVGSTVSPGLPSFFNDYFLGGRFLQRGEPTRGQLIVPYDGNH